MLPCVEVLAALSKESTANPFMGFYDEDWREERDECHEDKVIDRDFSEMQERVHDT